VIEIFLNDFSQLIEEIIKKVSIRPRLLPSKSFPINCS